MNISITEASLEEINKISDLISNILKEMKNEEPQEIQFLLSRNTPEVIKDKIKTRDFFVMKNDDEIIGASNLCDNELRGMYIKSEYRNKGLGIMFLKFMENYAKDRGINQLHLCSSAQALEFYKKHGYSLISIEKRKHQGLEMAQRSMQKELI